MVERSKLIHIMIKMYTGSIILRLFVLQSLGFYAYGDEQLVNQDKPKVLCRSGGQMVHFFEVCDGIADCEDESDEDNCENEVVLMYYTKEVNFPRTLFSIPTLCPHHPDSPYPDDSDCMVVDGTVKFDIHGDYLGLKHRGNFTIKVVDERVRSNLVWYTGRSWSNIPFWRDIRMVAVGRQIDLFYTDEQLGEFFPNGTRHYVKRVSRTGLATMTRIEDKVTSLAADYATSTVYYVADSKIKMCDKDFLICSAIPTKFVRNPVILTVVPKIRTLFWIDRESPSTNNYSLFRYSLDKNFRTKLIRASLSSSAPQWLTHDSARDLLYWMNVNESIASIYSTAFDGTNLNTTPPVFINRTTSFAVFNNTLYWPDNVQKTIWKCPITNCSNAFLHRNFMDSTNLTIDQLMVDHRSWTLQRKIQYPCRNSTCSHLCLPSSKYAHECFCEDLKRPLSDDANNGYCEDNTLIAAYKNHLFVVALQYILDSTVNVRKNTLDIGSIANIVYNSIDGTVFLTEMGVQNIYRWTPRTGELELIIENGFGTINCIEIDKYANNLYWLDPVNLKILALNIPTRRTRSIFQGNTTYSPFQFTLAPTKGHMFVLFSKDNVTVVMERVSMDGLQEHQKILYEDEGMLPECVSLQYVHTTQYELLLLLDKEHNRIRYFSDDNAEFRDLGLTLEVNGKIGSVVSLKNDIIWSEDRDFVIEQTRIRVEGASKDKNIKLNITHVQRIPLNLKKTDENSVLKIAAVEKWTDHLSAPRPKCISDNGGCASYLMCLTSGSENGFSVCLCSDADEVEHREICKDRAFLAPNRGETNTSSAVLGVHMISAASGVDQLRNDFDMTTVFIFFVSFILVYFVIN